jgi:L-alanine-DL-glutamate epimerase-like enolase superfamily enzyme
LRRELVSNEIKMIDGEIALPKRPGLGVDLNREALERFKREATAAVSTLSLC